MNKKHIYDVRGFDKQGNCVTHKSGIEGIQAVIDYIVQARKDWPTTIAYLRVFDRDLQTTRYVGNRKEE